MRPDELPIVVRRSRRITKDSSAVLTPETDYPLSNSRKKDNTSECENQTVLILDEQSA